MFRPARRRAVLGTAPAPNTLFTIRAATSHSRQLKSKSPPIRSASMKWHFACCRNQAKTWFSGAEAH